MIALFMMKMSLISMSNFVKCIEFASTHQIGNVDFARGISIYKLNGCKKGKMFVLTHPCELCNECGHLNIQCKLFHDRIVSKNCDDLISLAHHNEVSLLLGYEELKRLTKDLPDFALKKFLDIDLEKIYLYCKVNCIENPYIAIYIKTIKK